VNGSLAGVDAQLWNGLDGTQIRMCRSIVDDEHVQQPRDFRSHSIFTDFVSAKLTVISTNQQ